MVACESRGRRQVDLGATETTYEPVETPATDKFGNPLGQKKAIVSQAEA
jgi:hypothetical protein